MSSFDAGQREVLERIAGGQPLPQVLDAIVRLIERQSDSLLCSILLFHDATKKLHHGAAPSLPEAYNRAIDGLAIGPAIGSCGAAAHLRERVIVDDIASHPNWAAFRELALPHDLRACWSTPIVSAEHTLLGTFAIYYREARGPLPDELDWVSAATHLASIAIGQDHELRRRRELETELREAHKMEAVGKLAGGVARDFNDLLSVILSYAALVGQSLAADDPLHGDVEEIRSAGTRAAELVTKLLAMSSQQLAKPQALDLNELVNGVEKMLRRLLGSAIKFSFLPGAELGHVSADPGQLQQVIMNLAVNSREAMPKGGQLAIETANVELTEVYAKRHIGVRPGSYVMLAVTDTGTGIDPQTRAHIFEPFFTTKRNVPGAGLGLSTVWGIVSQSGGHITVHSEPDISTTFKVFLPRVKATRPSLMKGPKRSARPGGVETILLVEDDAQVRGLVRTILRRQGYTVLDAADGDQALALSERHEGPIHMLLTDIVMPRMSGHELAERIAKSRPTLPVLFMSGHVENPITGEGALDAKAEFVAKPLTPDTLLRKTREVLDAPGRAS